MLRFTFLLGICLVGLSYGHVLCSTNKYLRGFVTPMMNQYTKIHENVVNLLEKAEKITDSFHVHSDSLQKETFSSRRLFTVSDEVRLKDLLTIERYKMEFDERNNPERNARNKEEQKNAFLDLSFHMKASRHKPFRLSE